MPRLAGVDIPENKRVEVALTYIYGIGRVSVKEILKKAEIDGAKRVNELKSEDVARLQRTIDEVKVEGDLRKEVRQNITRLREIGAYRGVRHGRGLPVRGQRTRSNARTKRGKRVTIGAMKKDTLAKTEAAKAERTKKQEAKK